MPKGVILMVKSLFNCPFDPDEPLYIVKRDGVMIYVCLKCGYYEEEVSIKHQCYVESAS